MYLCIEIVVSARLRNNRLPDDPEIREFRSRYSWQNFPPQSFCIVSMTPLSSLIHPPIFLSRYSKEPFDARNSASISLHRYSVRFVTVLSRVLRETHKFFIHAPGLFVSPCQHSRSPSRIFLSKLTVEMWNNRKSPPRSQHWLVVRENGSSNFSAADFLGHFLMPFFSIVFYSLSRRYGVSVIKFLGPSFGCFAHRAKVFGLFLNGSFSFGSSTFNSLKVEFKIAFTIYRSIIHFSERINSSINL